MATFIVAHGAWSAGWAWKKMHPLLRGLGHELFVPTYTGLGERGHLASPQIDLETHVAEVAALLAWLGTTGVYLTALDDEAVSGALARTDLPAEARRALEIRALTSSASVKKLNAMTMTVCADGRARDLYT